MSLFVITYDLKQQGQNYECMTEKLRKLGAFHSQQLVWLLKSTSTAAALRDHLKECCDANDELLVAKIDGWASWNMPKDAEYLKS